MRTVVAQGTALVVVGGVIGVSAAIATGQLMTRLFHGVKPNDPTTLFGVTLLLVIVAIGATAIPAYRATTVDPMIALRCE